jgi:hypothetical protein
MPTSHRSVLLALTLAFAPLPLAAATAECVLAETDRAWIAELSERWRAVSRDALEEAPLPLPWIVFFNESCAWHLKPAAPLEGVSHDGTITLPNGEEVGARLMTFVATYDDAQTPFVVMAMPSIWRADPRYTSDPKLPQLMRAVFAHELTHARQTKGIGSRLDAVQRQHALPDDLNDDIVQQRFAAVSGFAAAYEAERDLLYRASRERSPIRQRALVAEAVAAMKARRATFFTGQNALFAEIEDIFLGMEGLGQFVAFRSAMLDGMAREEAIEDVRRGGRFWSQDEGLAAFLVIDALLPGWQPRVLGSTVPGVFQLLSEAASEAPPAR